MVRAYPVRTLLSCLMSFVIGNTASACLNGYTFTASPLPVNGTYACGQTVTFCFTVTNWAQQNSNWFHGISIALGPGWDAATLTPGPPPPTCQTGNGSWNWYTSVTGTSNTNIGPQGPGYFFNTGGPLIPGNNFGDNCSGSVNWQFCWTVSVMDAPGCVAGADLSVTVDTFGDSETGSWSGQGCHNDPVVMSPPAVVFNCPDAGIGTSIDLCSSSAPVSLLGQLLGTPSSGGTWTDPNGNTFNGVFDPQTDISGNYTYAVSSVVPPCSDASVLSVNVNTQPVAGTDSAVVVCSDDAPFALVDALGGDPDGGGAWTNAGGISVPAIFDPATGMSGTYTYQLTAPAPCTWVQAHASITVNPAPSAGTNGTLELCVTGQPVPLFSGLGGSPTPNGTWTDAGGVTVPPMFDPSLAPLGTQVFTYTVVGAPPCGTASSTLTVNVHAQPNAGTTTNLVVCSNDGPVSLFPLLGPSAQAGGIWTVPGGGAGNGTFTPGVSPAGNYAYTVAASAPCISSIALVHAVVNAAPDPGSDAVLNLCGGSTATSLFGLLGGADPGGAWTAPSGSTSNGMFDPLNSDTGVYTYTVSGAPPCASASSTVLVGLVGQPNAGLSTTLAICNSDAPLDLFNTLGSADLNGIWTGPGGVTSNGIYTPGVSAAGNYTYTIPGSPPCITASAVVTVSAFVPTNAGTDGTLSLCSDAGPQNLMTALGGSPSGGVWSGPNGTASNGTISPASALSGTYTYSVPANGPCPADASSVIVAITAQPDAGAASTLSLCSSDGSAHPLFGALAGAPQTGGTWTGPGGTAHGPDYIPGTDLPGVFTYTIQAPAPCVSASSTLTVSVVQAVDAGNGAVLSMCQGDAILDPQTWLSGTADPGGSWIAPNGAAITQVDPATALSGAYTYTVPGTPPCPADQATMVVTISPLPQAGTDGTLSLCFDAPAGQLMDALGGVPNAWGTWSGPTVLEGGSFNPVVDSPGTYTYTVAGTGACSDLVDSATVTVVVDPVPVPTVTSSSTQGCVPFQVQFHVAGPDLVAANWTFGDGTGADGVPDISHLYAWPGQYSVQVTVVDGAGCSGTAMLSGVVHTSSGPSPDFALSASTVSVDDPKVQLFLAPGQDVGYDWSLDGHPLNGAGDPTVIIDPPTVGEHVVCLTATDTLGCFNELCKTVVVDDNLGVFIPNAFTPDGDSDNETFHPVVIGYAPGTYTLFIFDRWGRTVFSSTDPDEAWNGALNNSGKVLPQAVYVWRISARDRFTTDQREWFGTVTLLK